MKQAALLLGSRGSDILDHFRSKSDQGGLLCRAVRHLSNQLTQLSGDAGREKCRDPNGERQAVVPLRQFCEYLGVDWSAQRQRLVRDEVLAARC